MTGSPPSPDMAAAESPRTAMLMRDQDEREVATVQKAIRGFDLVQLDKAAAALKRQREFLLQVVREGKGREGREKIRDHILDKGQEPLVVRLLDKVAFTFGVLNIVISEWVLLVYPERFWMWYSAIIPTLIAVRYPYYRMRKWQYFLLDFCYFVHLFCMVQLYVFPDSCMGMKLAFLFANGPLIWAIPSWRNSLVFHDMEKTSSVYVHFFPALLTLSTRWHATWQHGAAPPGGAPQCDDTVTLLDFGLAMAVYTAWQIVYFIKTEVVDRPILLADPALQTSLRWLTTDSKNALHKLVLLAARRMRIMARDETFEPSTLKTKIIFMSTQMAFTVVTMAPVPALYASYPAHAAFVLAMFGCAVWNGGNFYIEVFARRYWADLERRGNELRERRLLRKAMQNVQDENDPRNGAGLVGAEEVLLAANVRRASTGMVEGSRLVGVGGGLGGEQWADAVTPEEVAEAWQARNGGKED
ncbi:hypothetical protein JKP88DRAFT_293588 [Tribonema minus]|uniref:Glycerophosphocholine acyltransferase 1 n=1 Tax=Tribonema minus TaxID=303371 RepID=A0A836CMU1_9STRA|nr:hypothetical protein JKP88DRAFT_293588 [Tribonema minus]